MIEQELILKYINILRDKPYMIVNKIEGYNTYESFLNGFFLGIDISNGLNISQDFSSWVGDYYGVENTNTHWTGFLRVKFKGMHDKDMIDILFELLKQFLNSLVKNHM